MVEPRIALEQPVLVQTFTIIATVVTIEKEVATPDVFLLVTGVTQQHVEEVSNDHNM